MVSMPPAFLMPAASDPGWVSWCGQQLRVGLGAGLLEHGLSLGYIPGSFFRGECVNSHVLKKKKKGLFSRQRHLRYHLIFSWRRCDCSEPLSLVHGPVSRGDAPCVSTSCSLSHIEPTPGLFGISKGWPRLKLCRWLPALGSTVGLNELFGAHGVLIGGSNKVALGAVLLGSLRWWLRVR